MVKPFITKKYIKILVNHGKILLKKKHKQSVYTREKMESLKCSIKPRKGSKGGHGNKT